MLKVVVKDNAVRFGNQFAVSFQRTLRIPDDGKIYPLPPTLGSFPVCRVEDYRDRAPEEWLKRGGVFIPMYQREALWLAFEGSPRRPKAVQIAVGGINAISGTAWQEKLSDSPQNYIVCPDQPWLDGLNAGEGFIRQFVAMPLGMGYTVEAQLTGKEEWGGIQIRVYEPKPGRIPGRPSQRGFEDRMGPASMATAMGLGAGGKMKQKIYVDPYGMDTWDLNNFGMVFVHIVNSEQYHEITGRKPPRTTISAKTYTDAGFPWFDLYDETKSGVRAAGRLAKVKTVQEKQAEKANKAGGQADESVEVDSTKIKKIKIPTSGKRK